MQLRRAPLADCAVALIIGNTEILGQCRCGNLSFILTVPVSENAVEHEACAICVEHPCVWTAVPNSQLRAAAQYPALLQRNGLGADQVIFHLCQCGLAPLATCRIEGRLYAIVNANAFRNIPRRRLSESPCTFQGGSLDERFVQRTRQWIPHVVFDDGQQT